MTQTAKGYSDNRWATYKQIKDMGGQVRKGEKATHVLFYKFDDEQQKAQDQPDRPTTEGKGRAGTEKGPFGHLKRDPIFELWWSSRRGRTERSDGRPRRDERYCRGTSCVARDAWLRVATLSR